MELMKKEIALELDEAVKFAESSPEPALDSVYLNVY